ncbi:uncharacterized protein [Mytilus edulis]|uniref:uncharacterized protein n=1 Tax=Mytilus edulis TaxID=6550 RepID=UPI0039EFB157
MASKRRDTRKRTRGPELDPNNPNNWTSTELKEKLALLGIKISENFTNKQLKRIFLDNKKSSPESSDNGNTETNNISATVNTSLSPNIEDDVILSPTNTQNTGFSSLIPIASTSRMNTVEPTPLPVIGASAHQNHAFPPRTDLNTLDYALVNNTLQLCQQVIAGVPKQTNNNKFNLHSAMNFNPGPGSTLPVNQNTFGVQNPTLGEFTQTNPNQMNFPNSFASQVPIFSMQNQHMQMTKHGYPATAFSGVDMVSPEIRTKIISGKDINLNILLLPNYETPNQQKFKENDDRLKRNLTLDEFIIAFGRFKKIMCQVFPNRAEELDCYLSHIIETANVWPGKFFEYHKMFSAKCSIMLQEHNIKIDWSRGDLELRQMVCAGSTVNMCNFCSSTLHKSSMCGNNRGYQNSKTQPTQDKYGRDIVVHDGMQICNNFNQPKGCVKPYCRYAHVCKICKKTHEKFECSTNKSMPGTQQEHNKSFPVRQPNSKSK